ncbi:hypothetical protein V7S43_008091 [Phytophthora oleae]|uniref:Uncharacterized protein n=1 Tax=Phytophthora oleae TaxID=2107226 RepID=A0ABD3FL65_9STRA
MVGRLHSRDCQPRKPVTAKQASATVTRLIQWKKRNDAKREVKAQLQEDERIEEEKQFLSSAKTLPLSQVQAAALRNYHAANTLRWKKLVLQSLVEQQQLDEEEAECTFQPRLVARSRRSSPSACQSEKKCTCRSSCAAAAANLPSQPRKLPGLLQGSRRLADGDVFERLYKPQAETLVTTTVYTPGSTAKRTSSRVAAAFVARQERDQEDRQRRRLKQAVQERYSHMPKLSKHSREICAALREGEAEVDGHYRRKKHSNSTRKLGRQPLYTIPACPAVSKQSEFARSPFTSIIQALQQQEETMRSMSKCAKSN